MLGIPRNTLTAIVIYWQPYSLSNTPAEESLASLLFILFSSGIVISECKAT